MLTEDFVARELAVLLAGKGFDVPVCRYYNDQGDPCVSTNEAFNWNALAGYHNPSHSRPTMQMVLKWLRVVKHVDIVVGLYGDHHDGSLEYFAEVYLHGHKLITEPIVGTHEGVTTEAVTFVLTQIDL